MENHADQRIVVARQAEEFCLLTDSVAGVAYASARKYEWHHDDEKRRAWLHVEKICEYFGMAEFPTNSGRKPIPFIGDALGANVAIKLYRYYLSQCERYGIEKNPYSR
ncbi:MAG: hypothetical protein AABN34_15500 [Acidobacteriota bacterium]